MLIRQARPPTGMISGHLPPPSCPKYTTFVEKCQYVTFVTKKIPALPTPGFKNNIEKEYNNMGLLVINAGVQEVIYFLNLTI